MHETEQQRKDREHQEDLARLRGLRPIDDDFMRCIFRENKALAQLVLSIITEKPDLEIIRVETQMDMKRLAGARSICLDAYAKDAEDKKYDLEIQRANRGAGKHRARYHSSCMDVENLDAGQEFDELPDTYTIFLTERDLFGKGNALYPIERVNTVTGELFDDGEHILYVNGAYRDDSDLGKLMHDFCSWDPEDMNFDLMKEATRYYKEDEEGVKIMCEAFEETRNEGAMRKAIDTAIRMIKRGKCTLEEIAEDTELPIDKVRELAETRSAS
ncbi:MAG: PD-(D/E)XK nuclease family transposase [Eubacterium sp.]|nr:PD-(D/E)XK nuclease family transposase [Eubacterium sp.]